MQRRSKLNYKTASFLDIVQFWPGANWSNGRSRLHELWRTISLSPPFLLSFASDMHSCYFLLAVCSSPCYASVAAMLHFLAPRWQYFATNNLQSSPHPALLCSHNCWDCFVECGCMDPCQIVPWWQQKRFNSMSHACLQHFVTLSPSFDSSLLPCKHTVAFF